MGKAWFNPQSAALWPEEANLDTRSRYHGGRRPSSDDSLHSPTIVFPPSAFDKPSTMKRYHRRRTTRWGVTACSLTMVTLYDNTVCRAPMVKWLLDCENCRYLTVIGLHDTSHRLQGLAADLKLTTSLMVSTQQTIWMTTDDGRRWQKFMWLYSENGLILHVTRAGKDIGKLTLCLIRKSMSRVQGASVTTSST